MSMQVFSARVRGGAIVPEDGVTLPEGTAVTVIADGDTEAFETTPEEERELLDAIAGVEREKPFARRTCSSGFVGDGPTPQAQRLGSRGPADRRGQRLVARPPAARGALGRSSSEPSS